MRSLRIVTGAGCVAALTLAVAACGEKPEPDLSRLPPPPQPQPPSPPAGLPRAVVGRWQGTLRQRGLKPFAIRARVASATDPKRNPVFYGGRVGCSGTWTYRGVEGARVRFRETIVRGAGGKCKGRGTVTVRPLSGRRLRYEFRSHAVTSRGVLERR